MSNLKDLETAVLMDMLVNQTSFLTAMMAKKGRVSMQAYKYEVMLIQRELRNRLNKTKDPVSNPIDYP